MTYNYYNNNCFVILVLLKSLVAQIQEEMCKWMANLS